MQKAGPDAPRCEYFIPTKKRRCKFQVKPGQRFCGNHLYLALQEGERRVPCPVDPRHTVLESELRVHVKKCPKAHELQEQQAQPYYEKDTNAGSDDEAACGVEEPKAQHSTQGVIPSTNDIPHDPAVFSRGLSAERQALAKTMGQDKFMEIVRKVEAAFERLHPAEGLPTRVTLPSYCEQYMQPSPNRPYWPKHALQQASMIGNMERAGLLPALPQSVLVEFGAGKGYLSDMIAECCGVSKVVLMDCRGCFKLKADRSLRKCMGPSNLQRLTCPIQDFRVSQVPGLDNGHVPWVAAGKHLCGAASDFALRSCAQAEVDAERASNERPGEEVVSVLGRKGSGRRKNRRHASNSIPLTNGQHPSSDEVDCQVDGAIHQSSDDGALLPNGHHMNGFKDVDVAALQCSTAKTGDKVHGDVGHDPLSTGNADPGSLANPYDNVPDDAVGPNSTHGSAQSWSSDNSGTKSPAQHEQQQAISGEEAAPGDSVRSSVACACAASACDAGASQVGPLSFESRSGSMKSVMNGNGSLRTHPLADIPISSSASAIPPPPFFSDDTRPWTPAIPSSIPQPPPISISRTLSDIARSQRSTSSSHQTSSNSLHVSGEQGQPATSSSSSEQPASNTHPSPTPGQVPGQTTHPAPRVVFTPRTPSLIPRPAPLNPNTPSSTPRITSITPRTPSRIPRAPTFTPRTSTTPRSSSSSTPRSCAHNTVQPCDLSTSLDPQPNSTTASSLHNDSVHTIPVNNSGHSDHAGQSGSIGATHVSADVALVSFPPGTPRQQDTLPLSVSSLSSRGPRHSTSARTTTSNSPVSSPPGTPTQQAEPSSRTLHDVAHPSESHPTAINQTPDTAGTTPHDMQEVVDSCAPSVEQTPSGLATLERHTSDGGTTSCSASSNAKHSGVKSHPVNVTPHKDSPLPASKSENPLPAPQKSSPLPPSLIPDEAAPVAGACQGGSSHSVGGHADQRGTELAGAAAAEAAGKLQEVEVVQGEATGQLQEMAAVNTIEDGEEAAAGKLEDVAGVKDQQKGDKQEVEAGSGRSGLQAVVLAPCCHHRCTWKAYVGKKVLRELGIGKEEFDIISWMTGWALCGHDSPPGMGDLDDEEEDFDNVQDDEVDATQEEIDQVEASMDRGADLASTQPVSTGAGSPPMADLDALEAECDDGLDDALDPDINAALSDWVEQNNQVLNGEMTELHNDAATDSLPVQVEENEEVLDGEMRELQNDAATGSLPVQVEENEQQGIEGATELQSSSLPPDLEPLISASPGGEEDVGFSAPGLEDAGQTPVCGDHVGASDKVSCNGKTSVCRGCEDGDAPDVAGSTVGGVYRGEEDNFDPSCLMTRSERMALGLKCKMLIDLGRKAWMEEQGWLTDMVVYIQPDVSGENKLFVARCKRFTGGHV